MLFFLSRESDANVIVMLGDVCCLARLALGWALAGDGAIWPFGTKYHLMIKGESVGLRLQLQLGYGRWRLKVHDWVDAVIRINFSHRSPYANRQVVCFKSCLASLLPQ